MASQRARSGQWCRYLLGLGVGAGLIVVAIPSMSGTAMNAASSLILGVPLAALVGLVVLWIAGLGLHTITLTAALPELTHRRALTLSLTGSAVANVLPLGGAAGMALNYRMIRGWGFQRSQFASYTLVTNVWDLLAKLALPLIVLPLILFGPVPVPARVLVAGAVALGTFALLLATTIGVLRSERIAARVGRLVDRTSSRILSVVRSSRRLAVEPFLLATHAECRDVVAARWRRLTIGMLLYTAAVLALLWACLGVTGAGLPFAAVLVGFTAERLLTLVLLTPGGAGVVEVGLAGTLLLLGGDPAGVVAGVLLYRILTFVLEIPVGGATLAGWWWSARRSMRRQPRALLGGVS